VNNENTIFWRVYIVIWMRAANEWPTPTRTDERRQYVYDMQRGGRGLVKLQ